MSDFRSLQEKQAYRRLEKLHWRIIQLHKMRMSDAEVPTKNVERVERQIDELQREIDELHRELFPPTERT